MAECIYYMYVRSLDPPVEFRAHKKPDILSLGLMRILSAFSAPCQIRCLWQRAPLPGCPMPEKDLCRRPIPYVLQSQMLTAQLGGSKKTHFVCTGRTLISGSQF